MNIQHFNLALFFQVAGASFVTSKIVLFLATFLQLLQAAFYSLDFSRPSFLKPGIFPGCWSIFYSFESKSRHFQGLLLFTLKQYLFFSDYDHIYI